MPISSPIFLSNLNPYTTHQKSVLPYDFEHHLPNTFHVSVLFSKIHLMSPSLPMMW